VPHAFQHIISQEKTPTLGHAIPAFEAMLRKWEEYAEDNPGMSEIIEEGLRKLGTYRDRVDTVPAYVLAMGTPLVYLYCQQTKLDFKWLIPLRSLTGIETICLINISGQKTFLYKR
jgi:hypothetical protein